MAAMIQMAFVPTASIAMDAAQRMNTTAIVLCIPILSETLPKMNRPAMLHAANTLTKMDALSGENPTVVCRIGDA